MNSNVFAAGNTSRSANRGYNNTTIQSQEVKGDLLEGIQKKENLTAVKTVKPSKRVSTYENSFTQGQLNLHKAEELKNAEEYLSRKKRNPKETNLPGFTENRVSPEVKASLVM